MLTIASPRLSAASLYLLFGFFEAFERRFRKLGSGEVLGCGDSSAETRILDIADDLHPLRLDVGTDYDERMELAAHLASLSVQLTLCVGQLVVWDVASFRRASSASRYSRALGFRSLAIPPLAASI